MRILRLVCRHIEASFMRRHTRRTASVRLSAEGEDRFAALEKLCGSHRDTETQSWRYRAEAGKNSFTHTEAQRHRVGATALKLGNCCAASLREPSTLMQTHWRKLHASTSMSSGFATAHQIGNRL